MAHQLSRRGLLAALVALVASPWAGRLVARAATPTAPARDPIDPLAHRTTLVYDLRDRSWAEGLGQCTTFSYDANGRLTSQTDPGGAITTFTYDLSPRLRPLR